jgi:hypothetical protein
LLHGNRKGHFVKPSQGEPSEGESCRSQSGERDDVEYDWDVATLSPSIATGERPRYDQQDGQAACAPRKSADTRTSDQIVTDRVDSDLKLAADGTHSTACPST